MLLGRNSTWQNPGTNFCSNPEKISTADARGLIDLFVSKVSCVRLLLDLRKDEGAIL